VPEYGERSPDGFYWWDGNAWQSVQGGTAGESEGNESQGEGEGQHDTAAAAGQVGSQAGGQVGSQAGGQAGGQTDGQTGGGTEGVLAKVNDPAELQDHFENAMAAAEGQVTDLEG
jgi:hypothetical protein